MNIFDGFWFWLGSIMAKAFVFLFVIVLVFLLGLYVAWVDSKKPCTTCGGLGGIGNHCPTCFKKKE